MNEPKRRGRPPKARIEGADVVALPVREMGVPGDFVLTEVQHTQPPVLMARDVICDAEQHKAQAYALRVWNGQSPNVPRNERIKRVKAALVGQNLPTEGIELP